MVISNASQEFILSVVDYNQEYNTKIIVLGFVLLYSIFFLWYQGRIGHDMKWKIIVRLMMIVFGFVMIFLFPLFAFFLYREYALSSLLNLLMTLYTVIFIIMGVLVWIWGFDVILNMLGIKGKTTERLKRRDK